MHGCCYQIIVVNVPEWSMIPGRTSLCTIQAAVFRYPLNQLYLEAGREIQRATHACSDLQYLVLGPLPTTFRYPSRTQSRTRYLTEVEPNPRRPSI